MSEENKNPKFSYELEQHLTDHELLFCETYLQTFSLRRTIERLEEEALQDSDLGLRKRTNHYASLYARPVVQEYLQLRKQEIKSTFFTYEDYLHGIMEVIQDCREEKMLKDKFGMPTGEVIRDNKGALMGYKLLGEAMKLVESDAQIQGSQSVTINHVTMTEEQQEAFKESFDARY